MANTLVKAALAIALLGAAAAGGLAMQSRSALDASEKSAGGCRAELDACVHARDEERASKDKALSEAAATLDASRTELDELRVERAEAEKHLAAFRSLTEKFRKMIDSGKLQVILRHGRMVVKLPASVLFASGHAELSKEGKDSLRDVATILRQVTDRRFMVAGHTDNVPVVPPSPFKNNLELSTARALTVAQQLVASGIGPSRLVAAGYAEFEPVRENTTDAGRQENRRIEIVLMPNVTELPLAPGDTADGGVSAGGTGTAGPGAGDAGGPPPSAGDAGRAARDGG